MNEYLQRVIKYLNANPRIISGFLLGFLLTSVFKRKSTANAIKSIPNTIPPERVSFSEFLQKVDSEKIADVLLKPNSIEFSLKSAEEATKTFVTTPTTFHPGVVELLYNKKIPFDELRLIQEGVNWKSVFFIVFPFVYLGAVIYVFKKYLNPNGDSGSNFKKNQKSKKKRITFDDVAGVGHAKNQVIEITRFYASPERYMRFGARVPKGVLLVGPPGTGKTMLARALAAECDLPFFYCSGSDFVEVYAGRGASRVRALFGKARKSAPSVIFIDEIDALGKRRSNDFNFSGSDEREQTLNQLLSCMDGFDNESSTDDEASKQVICLAATNRYESLDAALTRPGRFDRIVHVGLPDKEGRIEVFKVHTKRMQLQLVDFESLSLLSGGFSGAEIAHLCNEAAISAIRRDSDFVEMDDFLGSLHEFRNSRKKTHSQTQNGGSSGLINQFFQQM